MRQICPSSPSCAPHPNAAMSATAEGCRRKASYSVTRLLFSKAALKAMHLPFKYCLDSSLFVMSLYPNHAVDKEARFFARFESVHNLPPPHVAHAHGGVENAWEAPKPEYVKRAMVTQTTFRWGVICLKRQPFSYPILENWN